jgi:hypothetical protein
LVLGFAGPDPGDPFPWREQVTLEYGFAGH